VLYKEKTIIITKITQETKGEELTLWIREGMGYLPQLP
jgi:hypothetical protein